MAPADITWPLLHLTKHDHGDEQQQQQQQQQQQEEDGEEGEEKKAQTRFMPIIEEAGNTAEINATVLPLCSQKDQMAMPFPADAQLSKNCVDWITAGRYLLLIQKMPRHSRSIRVRPREKRVLILSSVRASTLPRNPVSRATVNPASRRVELAERRGEASWKDLLKNFLWYAALSKQAYAARHQYLFALLDSDDFRGASGSGGRTGEYAKPHMLKHALTAPELCGDGTCDWVLWLDADSFIHPALFDITLDSWLYDVPEDRIIVLGNRVALNTGVMFLRAGDRDTRLRSIALIEDWILATNLIHCHSFDQAALQLLLLRAVREHHLATGGEIENTGTRESPFLFTCVSPWCSQNLTKDRHNKKVPFWSCNPLFDKKLIDSGWHDVLLGKKNFPRLSTLPLWVSSENAERPRLHVVEKHKMGSNLGSQGVTTVVEGWDYGGNFDYNFSGAPHSPTWFIDHHKQVSIFFFEAHQSHRACGDLLQHCDAYITELEVHGRHKGRVAQTGALRVA